MSDYKIGEPPFIDKLKVFASVQKFYIVEQQGTINCRLSLVLGGTINPEALLPIIRVTVGESVEHLGSVHARVDSVQFHSGATFAEYLVIWRTPPAPMRTVLPKLVVPAKLSPDALALLEALYDNAEFRVTWRYQSPRAELSGKPMLPAMWHAFTSELEQRGEADFFDGYRWLKSRCTLHPYTEEYAVETTEDYVVVGHRLNEAGRKFVEANRRAVTP